MYIIIKIHRILFVPKSCFYIVFSAVFNDFKKCFSIFKNKIFIFIYFSTPNIFIFVYSTPSRFAYKNIRLKFLNFIFPVLRRKKFQITYTFKVFICHLIAYNNSPYVFFPSAFVFIISVKVKIFYIV